MKKALRILLWIILLFVVLSALSLAALYMLADPDQLKPVITSEVMKRTGYRLDIDGKLTWSLYPQVGVKASHLTLTAPAQKAPFLDMRRVNIAVELSQLLRGVNKLSGEVHIASVTLMNVKASSALVGLHWQDNTLTLRPIQASMYSGSMSGMARGKDFSGQPAWNWDVTLSHVDMQPLLRDASGEHSKLKLSGTGQVRISASTQGNTKNQMLSNLNGVTDFSITNGVVQGVDVNYLLTAADALLNKKAVVLPSDIKETKFDSLAGSMLINNGLAQTNNLRLTASAFKVNGQGNYSLPHETIDLSLQVHSQDELQSQWEIPVLVTGALAHPDVRLDMREINKQIASREIARVKDKVKEKIKEKVPGEAGEILQNLLGD